MSRAVILYMISFITVVLDVVSILCLLSGLMMMVIPDSDPAWKWLLIAIGMAGGIILTPLSMYFFQAASNLALSEEQQTALRAHRRW